MKFDRKLFSVLLAVSMLMSMILPISAAQMEATYGEASYYDIAVESLSRMLMFHDGVVAAANQNRQYGLITSNGEIRVDFQYDGLWYMYYNLFAAQKGGRYGVIDSKGNIVEPINHYRLRLIRDGYVEIDGEYYAYTADWRLTSVSYNEAYGYDDDGMTELAERLGYDYMYRIDGSHYMAYKYDWDDVYGTAAYYYLDQNYQPIISASWLDTFWTNDGEVYIYSDEALYNSDGAEIFNAAEYGLRIIGYSWGYRGGFLRVYDTSTQKYGGYDLEGNVLIPCEYQQIGHPNQLGYIGAIIDRGYTYVDTDLYSLDSHGEPVDSFKDTYIATEVYYRHLVYNTSEGGLYGMMELDKTSLIPENYTTIDTDGNNNLLTIQGNPYYGGTYGLRDLNGRVIFNDGYQSITHLSSNNYKLRDNSGLYGIMNTSGRTLIPFDYRSMWVQTDTFIQVYDGRHYKYLDLNNETIVRESNEYIDLFGSDLSKVHVGYDGWLPFCIRTDEGYATVYANVNTGATNGELAHRTSGINDDGMFAYQDDNTNLFGFGTLGTTDIIASGICGQDDEGNLSDNLTWTLYSNGLLEIKGKGNMRDYYPDGISATLAPWYDYREQVYTVVISNGVNTIGNEAFDQCSNLISVTIPDSVTSIGDSAFSLCSSLTSVTIPAGVTSIGAGAFSYCFNLTSVTISAGVTSIGAGAFLYCSSLTSVDIPDSITTIEYNAFAGCDALTDVYYDGTKSQWNVIDIAETGNDPLLNAVIHCKDGNIGGPDELLAVKYVPYSYTLKLSQKVVVDGQEYEFTASRYALEDGSLPSGLILNAETGEISGVPMANGTFEFKVRGIIEEGVIPGSSTTVTAVIAPYKLTVQSNTNDAVQRPNDYPILDNVGTRDPRDPNGFLMTEYRDEEFIIDGPYEEFHRLLIDGKERIRDVDYTVREGSTVITIQAQTFRDVGEGTHTIAAEFRSTDESGKETIKHVAQNYTLTINRPSDNTNNDSSSSGSSSSDSSSTSYSITVPRIPNCTVTVTPTSASANARVTLTVRPNTGYKLSGLTVTGPKGEQIPLTQTDEFQYTFRMPSGNVNISAQVEREQPVQTPAGDTPFVDMLETDWFYQSVRTAYERGWMAGTSANTFAPYTVTSRGMFVAVLHRIAGEPSAENNSYFSDVPLNQYYATAAAWAAENGIVSGYGDGRFGSTDDLTREQIVMILYNYANLTGMDTTTRSELTQFNDLDKLSSGAQAAMSWASSVGLISGKGNGILDPTGSATRAEMAALLVRFAALTEIK